MKVVGLSEIEGRRYPAGRRSQNLVGGVSPLQAEGFCMGHVTLDPEGGQVPWHNHPQEEIYLLIEGTAEMCVGDEVREMVAGEAVYIPSGAFHQLTNLASVPARFVYVYAPAGDVEHWRQELAGTLPVAGAGAPPLPPSASPQKGAQSA